MSSKVLEICLRSVTFDLLARGSNSNLLVDGSICIKEPSRWKFEYNFNFFMDTQVNIEVSGVESEVEEIFFDDKRIYEKAAKISNFFK